MKQIILASASPRRKELLLRAGIDFKVVPSNYEEKLNSLIFSEEKIEDIAKNKALDVAARFPDDIIVSADTVVVLNNKIFTKPKNNEHAKSMLKELSGKTHFVQTSICVVFADKIIIKSTKTYVTFNILSDEDINNYIKAYKPFDKAGAYGIQELPENFIKNVDGDIENVIGIPTKVLGLMLTNVN